MKLLCSVDCNCTKTVCLLTSLLFYPMGAVWLALYDGLYDSDMRRVIWWMNWVWDGVRLIWRDQNQMSVMWWEDDSNY